MPDMSSTMPALPPTGTPSPCVRLCTLNDDDVCIGCGRTLDDIKGWMAMPDEAKRACVQRGHRRLQELGLPVRTAPVVAPTRR
jgi:predicted Fe-S protein YdhL (DUF1289 family)